MSTNVPAPTFGPNGFLVPSQSAVLAGVIADINAAFGGNLNFSNLETPQGQLASSMAAIVGEVYDTFLKYTQQVDPAFADGRMQDGIGRIYFLERKPAQPTVVTATCTGLPGTVIPAEAIAQAEDGNLYKAVDGGTIPSTGSVDLQFACAVNGPIPCPVGSLDKIFQAVPGWDSIANAQEGVLGSDTEGRQAFENRRAASVAQNAEGMLPAIRGVVLALPGVLDCYVTENPTGSVVPVKGFDLDPHSLYVAVVGGDNEDVARAIWTKKAPGCGYNGNTTVAVQDDSSGYTPPFPSYDVTFERPSALAVAIKVTLVNSVQVPSDALTQIQAACVAAFAGADGEPRAQIGGVVYASRFYSAVAALGSWAQILSITLGSINNAAKATFSATIATDQLTVTAGPTGTIAVGQTVQGPGVLPGTRIAAGSGSPWTLNQEQTVTPAQAMTSFQADQPSVDVGIDQAPTLDPADVQVVLV